MIAFCWAVPFLIILPSLTGIWGKHGLDCKTRSCTIIDTNDGSLSFKKFLMSVGVAIPSLILIVIHLMIYEKVRLESVRKSIRKLKVNLCQKRLLQNKYSKSLSWGLNLDFPSKKVNNLFKFSVQDSNLEYLFRSSKNSPVSSDLKPPFQFRFRTIFFQIMTVT